MSNTSGTAATSGGSSSTGGKPHEPLAGSSTISAGTTTTSAGAGAVPAGGGASVGGGAGGGGPDLSAELYDAARFPRFDFELPAASLTALKAVQNSEDPKQDEYVTATLTYDKMGANEVTANVGLRIKGEGSFLRFDQKPALKVKIDKFVDGQRFRGLARLTLNNNFDDPSFVAERLAYDVYRAAGVPAPRCNSAQVYVNGEFYGVYTNLEPEDKQLLKRWFPTDGGNLFEKDGMGDFTTQAAGEFQLETNETANDRTDLNQLISTIQGATTPATFLETIGTKLNTSNMLLFFAGEAAVNQWDSYSFTIWWTHNFRIYDDPTSKKFHFIPWGHDLSMKPAPFTGKQFVEPFTLAHESDNASRPVTSGLLFQRCLTSPPCKAAYKEALTKVTDAYEKLGLPTVAPKYYAQIKDQVYADKRKQVPEGPLSNADFDKAYGSVLAITQGRVAALRAAIQAN